VSKAGLEVLAIVLYSGGSGVSASDVEQIRGVNSNYTLRQLTMRGLLSKERSGIGYKYTPTADLLSYLGVTDLDSIPGILDIRQKIDEFISNTNNGNL